MTTFDERALASLPEVAGFTGDLRRRAFGEFESLPTPSQETEEWRYTDLSDLQLTFAPFTSGGGPEAVNTHGLLQAAGGGERAGLMIQRNSEVISAQRASSLDAKGVIFTDLDAAAAEHTDLVERFLHDLVPTKRTRFTALHAAFRTGGTFLYVPRDTKVDLPLQTLTYVDVDGAAVFPHTLIVVDAGAEVTFIERYASPDLTRAFSDAVTEIHVGDGAHVRYAAIQDWGPA
jgi:Fe-S cluster assembly protein SufD